MLRRLARIVIVLALIAAVHRSGGVLQALAKPAAILLYLVPLAVILTVIASPVLLVLCLFAAWYWRRTGRPPRALGRGLRCARNHPATRRVWRRLRAARRPARRP